MTVTETSGREPIPKISLEEKRARLEALIAKERPAIPDSTVNMLLFEGGLELEKKERAKALMRSESRTGLEIDQRKIEILRGQKKVGVPVEMRRKDVEIYVEQQLALETQHKIDGQLGIFSREFCFDVLKKAFADFCLGGDDTVLIYIDLDNLKGHNEISHAQGNGAMQILAWALEGTKNVAARFYSGDEYVLIIPGGKHEEVFGLMKKVREEEIKKARERLKANQKENLRVPTGPVKLTYGFSSFTEILETIDLDQLAEQYGVVQEKIIQTLIVYSDIYMHLRKRLGKKVLTKEAFEEIRTGVSEKVREDMAGRDIASLEKIINHCFGYIARQKMTKT